jgi:hypothetical protein
MKGSEVLITLIAVVIWFFIGWLGSAWVFMGCWNSAAVSIFAVRAIDYWQSLQMLLLIFIAGAFLTGSARVGKS